MEHIFTHISTNFAYFRAYFAFNKAHISTKVFAINRNPRVENANHASVARLGPLRYLCPAVDSLRDTENNHQLTNYKPTQRLRTFVA